MFGHRLDERFPDVILLGRNFVKVGALSVVVLMKTKGELKSTTCKKIQLGANMRNIGVLICSIQVVVLFVRSAIVRETPRVQTGKNGEVEFLCYFRVIPMFVS